MKTLKFVIVSGLVLSFQLSDAKDNGNPRGDEIAKEEREALKDFDIPEDWKLSDIGALTKKLQAANKIFVVNVHSIKVADVVKGDMTIVTQKGDGDTAHGEIIGLTKQGNLWVVTSITGYDT